MRLCETMRCWTRTYGSNDYQPGFTKERDMFKRLIAMIAAVFAASAVAQTTATPTAPPPDTKAKQEMVKSTTESTQIPSLQTSKKSTAAAATKDTPKPLTDKAAKQEAVKTTTEATQIPSLQTSKKSTKAAAEKNTPKKPKPVMGEHQEALQKAAKP